MKPNSTKCAAMDGRLAELLLDPESASAKARTHVEECESCQAELDELKATIALLDTWQAPEPNPYFMTRLQARMRDERETAPTGWLRRKIAAMRAGLVYGPHVHVRPLAAMALTILLLLGGGAYLDIANWDQAAVPAHQTAVVRDLQSLQNNAQLLDQLEALSDTGNSSQTGN